MTGCSNPVERVVLEELTGFKMLSVHLSDYAKCCMLSKFKQFFTNFITHFRY